MRRTVAIVIPVYKPYAELGPSEKISLQRTFEVLGQYDIVFVTHASVDVAAYHSQQPGLTVKTFLFPPSCFTGLASYSELLLSPGFYQQFAAYDYMLICQSDVYVFADKLEYFISKGYDYIGAPWFEGYGQATAASPITGVGNGGFSLRKVQSFLSVLHALEVFRTRQPAWKVAQAAGRHWLSLLRVAKHEYHRRTRDYEDALPWNTPLYEDGYWGLITKKFFPWFKVGTVKDATAFCFEVNPRVLYELNNRQLPMATHAWEKYDLSFWKPFIEG